MLVQSPEFPESQLLEVKEIARERGKDTAILIAGVPGNEGLDDTEIPALKITGLIHLAVLTNKYFPSPEHSHPRIPINLWLKSPENAQSPGGDNLGVARSMSPVRERPIIRRSWQELLEAPLNSEGLHILQTVPAEEREIGSLQLPEEDKNQATNSLRSRHLHALQGPFPLLPQHPKLRRQRSHSLPGYSDSSSPRLNVPALKANPQETHFLPSDDTLFTQGNAKEKDSIDDTWQKAILPASAGQPPINPSFAHSSEMRGQFGIPGDNSKHPRGNARVPMDNVINPMVNVGVPMGNVGVSVDNYRIPMGDATLPLDNFEVPRGSGGAPMGNLKVPRGIGDGGVPRRHGIRIPVGNVETFKNNVGTSRRVISSPLIELSKIGEHQL
uniref:Uncharacterized protein n=1 Tax=Molossus molossus TaxID=27622 RepID=A0A7J8J7I1_MOLMO|nr:hypothetical protein HJG59_009576 [Molossus molossus]